MYSVEIEELCSINWYVFSTDMHCVYSVVGNDLLNKIKVIFVLQTVKRDPYSSDIIMSQGEALGIKNYVCDTSTDSTLMNKFYVVINDSELTVPCG